MTRRTREPDWESLTPGPHDDDEDAPRYDGWTVTLTNPAGVRVFSGGFSDAEGSTDYFNLSRYADPPRPATLALKATDMTAFLNRDDLPDVVTFVEGLMGRREVASEYTPGSADA